MLKYVLLIIFHTSDNVFGSRCRLGDDSDLNSPASEDTAHDSWRYNMLDSRSLSKLKCYKYTGFATLTKNKLKYVSQYYLFFIDT